MHDTQPVGALLALAARDGWAIERVKVDGIYIGPRMAQASQHHGVDVQVTTRERDETGFRPLPRIRPVTAADQVGCLRLVGGLRVHVLASAATALESSSTSTASGSKSSPTHSFISAWPSCAGSARASRNSP